MPQRRSHFPIPTSTPTPTPPKKRGRPPSTATPASRQSKRLKSSPVDSNASKTTPKKSPYFEHDSSSSEPGSEIGKEASGYEDEDDSASLVSSPPESDVEDSGSEEDVSEKGKLKNGKKTKVIRKVGTNETPAGAGKKGQELWRPGVKTDLEPGEAVFIPLPKARSAGSTPYKPNTIHPNTLLFLGDLRANNDREWLKAHDPDYRQAKKDWDDCVERLTEKIMAKDETIPDLPPKDLTFRIYRDIRFSPDPTPYKSHFSAAWSRTGRKGPYAGYYVQIQPGASFVGAGVWHPEAAPLALMRQDVDTKSHLLKAVLTAPELRREFFAGIGPDDEAKAVTAFVGMNAENMLKTKPRVCTW